jgi:hypothetical protein
MKDRKKDTTHIHKTDPARKHKADPAQEPVTESASPQAKPCSIRSALVSGAMQLPEEPSSLTPLAIIRNCSKALQKLEGQYRKLREHLLTTVYAQGLQLMTKKVEYEEFLSDPFWKDRQGEGPKPDDQRNAVRWSVIRALDAKEENENKAATRDGNAFQQLANEGVQPDNLWKAFKEGGGRDILSKTYVASQQTRGSKSAREELQKAFTKMVDEVVGEHVPGPRNFNCDIQNKRIEMVSVLIGARDGDVVWLPIEVRIVDKPFPDVAPDALFIMASKHVPKTKVKK